MVFPARFPTSVILDTEKIPLLAHGREELLCAVNRGGLLDVEPAEVPVELRFIDASAVEVDQRADCGGEGYVGFFLGVCGAGSCRKDFWYAEGGREEGREDIGFGV